VEANVVRGRILTSWSTLATDFRNAGGIWVDREVVTDQGLVTSRMPTTCRLLRQDRRGVCRGQAPGTGPQRLSHAGII